MFTLDSAEKRHRNSIGCVYRAYRMYAHCCIAVKYAVNVWFVSNITRFVDFL
jgi:hypothetical protein